MICQDSIQSSFFPPPQQFTLHTFLAFVNINGTISHHSMCVFSDCMLHNTVAVHEFLKLVIKHIFSLAPNLKKNTHFTDGAGSQYKNYKNFCNLLFHKKDFNVEAEWHFFATSHGKGPCGWRYC